MAMKETAVAYTAADETRRTPSMFDGTAEQELDALRDGIAALCELSPWQAAKKATALINRFGSLSGVIRASKEAVADEVGGPVARKLSALLPILRAIHASEMTDRDTISSARELEKYIQAMLTGLDHEEFWVICVNARCQVIGKRQISRGSISECAAYPREVVRAALDMNAHSVFLAHNHPGGTCAPSSEDISSTLQLQRALAALGIHILDHGILAGTSVYSMARHGDITFR